ncbi:hypothetical protein [Providencia rettgeri]|uniref:Type 1 fimbrial protein n=1 Tax=Providencia rettgeri TaxID=587 RepID=A0A3R8VYW7_PRORE|nr:hypothetical protein [Providencia rettgeri]MBV2188077.1 hypothetical protein [Providencia rettgeri]
MKLHHLALWILAMPAFSAELPLQTTGTLYVHARLVTAPCQPKVTIQRDVSHVNSTVYQLNVSFIHCLPTAYNQTWSPFTLKFAGQRYLASTLNTSKNMMFSLPTGRSTHRLEMIYD